MGLTMLKDEIQKSFIVAYRESVESLERALIAEGFSPKTVRPDYTAEELTYSAAVRCMLNHMNVWNDAAGRDGLTLVVEADFVPVRGLGDLPSPFPQSKRDCSFGYLYVGGAVLFDVHVEDGRIYGRGHGSCNVAYVIGPEAARCLIEFAKQELATQNARRLSLWDCLTRVFLQERGVTAWLPFRQYGEHGGFPNPEHAKAGHNPSHQSDRLFGPLHFMPLYAQGRVGRYRWIRLKAVLRGVARLVSGNYLQGNDIRRAVRSGTLIPMLRFAIGRYLSVKFLRCNSLKGRVS